jgi:hypothetical protein
MEMVLILICNRRASCLNIESNLFPDLARELRCVLFFRGRSSLHSETHPLRSVAFRCVPFQAIVTAVSIAVLPGDETERVRLAVLTRRLLK